jgi:hypothetical protein
MPTDILRERRARRVGDVMAAHPRLGAVAELPSSKIYLRPIPRVVGPPPCVRLGVALAGQD